MINKFQHFDIDKAINDNRNMSGIILKNGIKIILISDNDINKSVCSVGVGAGYLHDEYEGTAHFLEHLLFMGSEKYPEQNEYTSYIQTCGGSFNAFTADYMTLYYLELDTSFFKKGVEMLSWFFKKPILDMKFINSEREIINSEHEKNILDDIWIMDDVFKSFFKSGSKYKKFGTGNNESLQGITKDDIFKFYHKYYKSDNLYVCIVDSKPIDQMVDEYVVFFDSINNLDDNIIEKEETKDKIEYISENCIEFKSISEFNFLNIVLKIYCDEKNQIEFQLINLINWLIGLEYDQSLIYWLKENDIIKNLNSSIDYIYDYECMLNAKFILNNDKIENLDIIFNAFNDYLNEILKLNEKEFKQIYFNFQKIKMLKSLYSEKESSTEKVIEIVENMIKGSELSLSILRKNYVPEYKKEIFEKFKFMLKDLVIKFTTNLKLSNEKNYLKTKWYNTEYKLLNIDIIGNQDDIYEFKIMNCIGINNFNIKMNVLNYNYDKNAYPTLIYSNQQDKRNIYYLEHNKYDNPLANISVIRYNTCLSSDENNLIIYIYKSLCDEIIKYYTNVMLDYKLAFNLIINKDSIVYNFYGLNYLINNFIQNIIKMIHPDTIFLNPNIKKYYKKNIIDSIELLSNTKYNSPYLLCREYQEILLSGELLPNDKIKLLKNLSFDNFKKQCIECLKYVSESYIIVGIEGFDIVGGKSINEITLGNRITEERSLEDRSIRLISKNDISYLVDSLSLDPKRYLTKKNPDHDIKYYIDYKFKPDEMNPSEVNNCIIKNYLVNEIKINYDENNFIIIEDVKKIIRYRIILDIISHLINEPLFDQIRTVDKLGYIVKCGYQIQNTNNQIIYILYYLVQSTSNIKNINKSIKKFNTLFKSDIKDNKNEYYEKISSMIKSRLLLYKKPFTDLSEEVSTYLESFIEKIGLFNINKLSYNVCKKIKVKEVYKLINIFLDQSETGEIILSVENKN
jgi:insulysin